MQRLTDDSVAITFGVPAALRETFAFRAGQHVTVRRQEAGRDVRRSYSICSTPADLLRDGRLRIGVRQIPGGVFSAYAVDGLQPGELMEVLPPLGHFTTAFDPGRARHYGAVAAGSGITPVLSLLATGLATELESRFTLLYANRGAASVMFAEELADLKDRALGRMHVIHVLTREPQLSPLLSGRLDADRLRQIFDSRLLHMETVDEWFLCGPFGLVSDARGVLAERGVPDRAVHTELFHVADAPGPVAAPVAEDSGDKADVTIVLDGRASNFAMGRGERVLDAALRVRGELPYACKGGVCSTCRAKLVEGEVRMAQNYALEPDEVSAGYILTCQSSPISDRLVVDYDG